MSNVLSYRQTYRSTKFGTIIHLGEKRFLEVDIPEGHSPPLNSSPLV